MGRGIARRTLFLDRADCRYFLSCLAREAHHGGLVILAYSLMTTHFHVLVISVNGDLSGSMKRALSRYATYFNRKYRRDGPLFRSRFRSKPVSNIAYRRAVVRYIDRNPVQARLVSKPWEYPWGSAASYTAERRPPWLRDDAAPLLVREALDLVDFSPAAYIAFYEGARHEDVAAIVETALIGRRPNPGAFEDLVDAAPLSVQGWMRRKAFLADGAGMSAQPAARRPSSTPSRRSRRRSNSGQLHRPADSRRVPWSCELACLGTWRTAPGTQSTPSWASPSPHVAGLPRYTVSYSSRIPATGRWLCG